MSPYRFYKDSKGFIIFVEDKYLGPRDEMIFSVDSDGFIRTSKEVEQEHIDDYCVWNSKIHSTIDYISGMYFSHDEIPPHVIKIKYEL